MSRRILAAEMEPPQITASAHTAHFWPTDRHCGHLPPAHPTPAPGATYPPGSLLSGNQHVRAWRESTLLELAAIHGRYRTGRNGRALQPQDLAPPDVGTASL